MDRPQSVLRRFSPSVVCVASALLWAASPLAASDSPASRARRLLEQAGFSGGFIVHIGCGDGRFTAALYTAAAGAARHALVHGLDPTPENVRRARRRFLEAGIHGAVTADRISGARLPYADGIVNLVVVSAPGIIPNQEVQRVLRPGGAAFTTRDDGTWLRRIKPWPKNVDEWTHALHDPTNNAVSRDEVVGPPRHLQWVASPRWCRSHEHLAGISVVVTSGGRIFAIQDDAPAATVALPPRWVLTARDAFNGVLLWQHPIGPWENHLRGFRSGPADLQRTLVALGDTVYVIPGYGKAVIALDAATGTLKRTYKGTENACEIIVVDGILYVVGGKRIPSKATIVDRDRRRGIASPAPHDKFVMAVRAEDGRVLWRRRDTDTAEIFPTTLAAADDRVFFQNPDAVVCLPAKDGHTLWRTPYPSPRVRPGWSTPTLVVYDGVVFSAGRDVRPQQTPPGGAESAPSNERVEWIPSSDGGRAPKATLTAFDARTGAKLWSAPCREGYNSPVDIFIADGLLWTGNLTRSRDPGITQARDPHTGEVKRTRKRDQAYFTLGMGHHRCYRNKATNRYLILGRAGVEFVDVRTGEVDANHWVRGACQYGIVPANGLLYAPSHSCACFIQAKLHGFIALSPASPTRTIPETITDAGRLEKGPAWGAISIPQSPPDTDEWPTYRRDPARSGATSAPGPLHPKRRWRTGLGGALTPPVYADGRIFVARKNAGVVCALDGDSGRLLWQRPVGGPIDSPPTVWGSLVLFGCHDGYVYCLRSTDGELAWRFRAAPVDRRIIVYDRLESVWPVPGTVLVENGAVFAVAGRSSAVEGGLFVYRLDPGTGRMLGVARICTVDPKTGREPQKEIHGTRMPGVLPDVPSSDGTSLFLRQARLDPAGTLLPQTVPHLFSSVGFADDSWWHRTYWLYGTTLGEGWGGWLVWGNRLPAGRILVFDDQRIFGFGREFYAHCGSHVGLDQSTTFSFGLMKTSPRYRWLHYELFATPKTAVAEALRRGTSRRPSSMTSYVAVENTASLNPAGKPLTVAAWVYPEKPNGVVAVRGGTTHGYALYLRQGQPVFAVRVKSALVVASAPQPIPLKKWTHLAGVLDPGHNVHIIVNGKRVRSAKAPGFIAADPHEAMEIGADAPAAVGKYTPPANLEGRIDEVRIYLRALSGDELEALAGSTLADASLPAAGLVLYFPFDDNRADDKSGMNNDGRIVGATPVPGKFGNALYFNASAKSAPVHEKPRAWSIRTAMVVRGMALAAAPAKPTPAADAKRKPPAQLLYIAGAGRLNARSDETLDGLFDRDVLQPFTDVLEKRNARLWILSPDDGAQIARFDLGTPPVFDGLIVARRRLYLSLADGSVLCLDEEQTGK